MTDVKYFFSNEQILNRIFIMYGNTLDCYRTNDHSWLSIERMLESHLKFMGYQVVLFYGGNDELYSYDAELRANLETFFPPQKNKAAVQKKNAPAPKAPSFMDEIEVEDDESDISPDKNHEDETGELSAKIRKHAEDIPDYLNQIMHTGNVKSCVVLFNCWSFLGNMDAAIMNCLNSWYALPTENSNISIMLFKEPRLESLADHLSISTGWAFLYEHMFHDHKPTDAVIRVGSAQRDEIRYQLEEYFSIVTDELEAAALMLVQENSGLLQMLRKYLYENRFLPEDDLAEKILQDYGKNSKKDALERIRTTQGWEEVYRLLKRLIEEKDLYGKTDEDYPIENLTNLRMAYPVTRSGHKVNMNIMLMGNPGTGKSTVSKWIGLALQQNGLLPVAKVTKAAIQDLQGEHIGSSEIKTQDKINEAMGGVLFVDEAYALFDQQNTHASGSGTFGNEIINVFVDQMTSKKGEIAIIFAGYPDKMKHFMSANPGLNSRFGNNIIMIPDYPADKLEYIALKSIADNNSNGIGDPDGHDNENFSRFSYQFDVNLVYSESTETEDLSIGEKRKTSVSADEAILILNETRQKKGALSPISIYFDNWFADRDRTHFGNARDALELAKLICQNARTREDINSGMVTIMQCDFPADKQILFICRKPSVDEIKRQMDDIVGMEEVKDTMFRIATQLQMTIAQNQYMAKKYHRYPEKVEPGHYLFIGNPGVGKTMISEKLALTLSSLGIIDRYQPVRKTGLELMNMAAGHNGVEELKKFIENCKGGVLVIDEAHQFFNTNMGPIVVKALLDPMINLRTEMSFVFCCYPEYLEDFLSIEPGLERRISEVMRFEDYSPEEILKIFLIKAKKQFYIMAEGCEEYLLDAIKSLKKLENGGTAEKIFRQIKVGISQRLYNQYKSFEKIENEEAVLFTIEKEDIDFAIMRLNESEKAKRG